MTFAALTASPTTWRLSKQKMEFSGWQTQCFHHNWSHCEGLRRKVASKTEGLVILSREVEELREELHQVKLNMEVQPLYSDGRKITLL